MAAASAAARRTECQLATPLELREQLLPAEAAHRRWHSTLDLIRSLRDVLVSQQKQNETMAQSQLQVTQMLMRREQLSGDRRAAYPSIRSTSYLSKSRYIGGSTQLALHEEPRSFSR